MSDILDLLFARVYHTIFDTTQPFNCSVKLYNNTSLLDTFDFDIDTVIFGKRRIFDKLGELQNITTFDYDQTIGLSLIDYYFKYASDVSAIMSDDSEQFIDSYSGLVHINAGDVVGEIKYLFYIISNFVYNPSFNFMSGNNYWTTDSFPSCASSFGVTAANKLVLVIPDESCGNTFEIQYSGGTFVEGVSYSIWVTIDAVNNPSGNPYWIKADLGGNLSTAITGVGTTNVSVVCGAGGVLKLVAYMDADTGGFGSHGLSITGIQIKDYEIHKIELNQECEGIEKRIGLRYLNRFGMWRNYYVYLKSENIGSTAGIKLPFLEYNYTEFNSTFAEIKKGEAQSINVFRENFSKEIANDFSDIISSDHVHLYDDINSVWIPVKVNTNTFSIIEKETLFDVSLNLLLQSSNE
jgi:hypothetical protein